MDWTCRDMNLQRVEYDLPFDISNEGNIIKVSLELGNVSWSINHQTKEDYTSISNDTVCVQKAGMENKTPKKTFVQTTRTGNVTRSKE